VVLLNAAAALAAYEGPDADGLTAQLAAQLDVAREAIDSGAAARTLDTWVEATRSARSARD
jgi:anthranilate phosphoribosyltransferase